MIDPKDADKVFFLFLSAIGVFCFGLGIVATIVTWWLIK